MQTLTQAFPISQTSNPVILLNGPPKSGKNFLADTLMPSLDFRTQSLAITYDGKLATLEAFGLPERGITFEDMEKIKDEPIPLLDGMTWRYAISNTVETFKCLYGRDFWAKSMVRKIRWMERELMKQHGSKRVLFFITDPSFPEDVETFEREMPNRTVLVRVHRQGRTFDKNPGYEQAYGMGTGPDTRNWLFSNKLPSFDFINNGNEADALHDFIQHLRGYLDPRTIITDRNDRRLSQILIGKKYRIVQDCDLKPFDNPKIYWPNVIKHTGPMVDAV